MMKGREQLGDQGYLRGCADSLPYQAPVDPEKTRSCPSPEKNLSLKFPWSPFQILVKEGWAAALVPFPG